MSTLKVDAIRHNSATSDAITTAADGTCTAKLTSIGGGQLSNRNLVMNGSHIISQRGNTFAGHSSGDKYCSDRWNFYIASAGTFNYYTRLNNAGDKPADQGFQYAIKADCDTASSSLAAGAAHILITKWEGQDIQHIKKGTSNAEKLTLSFWVKSSKTGTHIAELIDEDNTRKCSQAYTISSTGTWEKKIITFPADTTGAFTNDNNKSMSLFFWLAAGSNYTSGSLNTTWSATADANRAVGQVNISNTTNDYWYMTGCQLEVGDTATSFEHISYGDDLRRCQRYFYGHSGANINGSNSSTPDTVLGAGSCQSTASASVGIVLPVPMRDVPSLYSTVTGSTRYRVNSAGANTNSGSDPVIWTAGSSHTFVHMDVAGFSGLVNNAACTVRRYQGSGVLGFSAEL